MHPSTLSRVILAKALGKSLHGHGTRGVRAKGASSGLGGFEAEICNGFVEARSTPSCFACGALP